MLLRLLRIAAVVGVVLVVPGSPFPEVAYAAPALPAPPPDCASTGPLLRYVTLFDAETPKRRAAREIRAACGTSVAYYPQIGVAVANLDRADFAARFGTDRADSAQPEALPAPQPTELSKPKANHTSVLRTADQRPARRRRWASTVRLSSGTCS